VSRKLVLSKELLLLAVEHGAAEAAKQYVEGTFAAQFPDMVLTFDSMTVNASAISEIRLNLSGGFEVEFVE
jgi:hypothetical protein